MPAKRLYTDAQRTAIWRLHEDGVKSPDIAKRCREGRTGLEPFQVPDRTIRAIIEQMREEASSRPPRSVLDLEDAEAMQRFPARAVKILRAEADRIEAKQRSRGLTPKDVDHLANLVDRMAALEKHYGAKKQKRRESQSAPGSQGRISAAEYVVRQDEERARAEDQPTDTHTLPQKEAEPVSSGAGRDDRRVRIAALEAVRKSALEHGEPVEEVDELIEKVRGEAPLAYIQTEPPAPELPATRPTPAEIRERRAPLFGQPPGDPSPAA